jgi:uncharacterized protein Yka (UPF0111/DUF47 family)
MALTPYNRLSDKQVEDRLRRAADLIAEADELLQNTFEADDDLYALCSRLQDYCADLEQEADEMQSIRRATVTLAK